MYDDLVRLCRERAEGYGALRRSCLTAIALDRSADAIERPQAELVGAVAKEREACAKVAEEHRYGDNFLDTCGMRREHREHIAAAIRERT